MLVDDRRLGPRLELARLRTAPGRGARDVLGGAGGAGRPNPAERLFDALDAVLKENRVGGQAADMSCNGHNGVVYRCVTKRDFGWCLCRAADPAA